MTDTQTDDDLSFPVRVTRVDHGIDVGTVHERPQYLDLPRHAGIHALSSVMTYFKPELFRKTGESFQCPAPFLARRRFLPGILFDIRKRKQVPERPGDQILSRLNVAVPLCLGGVSALVCDSRRNVSAERRLFRNDENHGTPSFSFCTLYFTQKSAPCQSQRGFSGKKIPLRLDKPGTLGYTVFNSSHTKEK